MKKNEQTIQSLKNALQFTSPVSDTPFFSSVSFFAPYSRDSSRRLISSIISLKDFMIDMNSETGSEIGEVKGDAASVGGEEDNDWLAV